MRLWTLHPKYLDRLGLVAVWREGLLAQAVLQGNTKGYKNHPQLDRFKTHPEPLKAITSYLYPVYLEAKARGYNFDLSKINLDGVAHPIQTTSGQLDFEVEHLRKKLKKRSKKDYESFRVLKNVDPHPLFEIIPGEIEDWEKNSNHFRMLKSSANL
jgi:hypothetical protein